MGRSDITYEDVPVLDQVEYRWVEDENGCWIWQRAKAKGGYGTIWVSVRDADGTRNGKKLLRAHRVVYEQRVGPIPEGMEMHHICGQPSCVNPAHLRPLTKSEHAQLAGPHNRKRRVTPKQLPVLRRLAEGPAPRSALPQVSSRPYQLLDTCIKNGWVERGGTGWPFIYSLTEQGRQALEEAEHVGASS